MLKVLLVDDEPSVIEGLKLFVNWGKLGFEIIGEAPDGVTSFSIIQRNLPDLVICDIRMPGLNGLELIEKVNNEIFPTPKFILLSGYNDFSYAQKALQLGAVGYLTKPLDLDELEQELLRALVSIENEKNTRQENLELIRYTANQLFNDIMVGKRNDKLSRKAQFIFDIPDNAKIRLLQFIVDTEEDALNKPETFIYDILKQLTGLQNENCLFYNGSGSYIIVLHDGLRAFFNESGQIEQLSKKIEASALKGFDSRNFGLLVSGINEGDIVDSIYSCGKQLEHLQPYYMLHPEQKIVYLNEHQNEHEAEALLPEDSDTDAKSVFPELPFDKVIESIKGKDKQQLINSVDEFFDKLNEATPSRRLYSICLYRLADLVRKMSYAYGIEANSAILKFTKSISNINPNTKNLAIEMCSFVFNQQNINNEKPLLLLENEILEYIRENFRESLSLQSIAEKFSLSPIIISKIVKKKTGQKFNNYFNSLRIEYAKMLIASDNMKITAICEQCGYSDYKYFTEKFKEFTGVSPSEYKKKYS